MCSPSRSYGEKSLCRLRQAWRRNDCPIAGPGRGNKFRTTRRDDQQSVTAHLDADSERAFESRVPVSSARRWRYLAFTSYANPGASAPSGWRCSLVRMMSQGPWILATWLAAAALVIVGPVQAQRAATVGAA